MASRRRSNPKATGLLCRSASRQAGMWFIKAMTDVDCLFLRLGGEQQRIALGAAGVGGAGRLGLGDVLGETATTQTPRWCAVIITLWAWSSVMRNSAFSTVTTNSRGVKSSLTRMTLCSRGRSVFGLTLVVGLASISLIGGAVPHGERLEKARSADIPNFCRRFVGWVPSAAAAPPPLTHARGQRDPWPTPMHIVASARLPSRSFISIAAVTRAARRDMPSGWPSAMAPPFGLTRSASSQIRVRAAPPAPARRTPRSARSRRSRRSSSPSRASSFASRAPGRCP